MSKSSFTPQPNKKLPSDLISLDQELAKIEERQLELLQHRQSLEKNVGAMSLDQVIDAPKVDDEARLRKSPLGYGHEVRLSPEDTTNLRSYFDDILSRHGKPGTAPVRRGVRDRFGGNEVPADVAELSNGERMLKVYRLSGEGHKFPSSEALKIRIFTQNPKTRGWEVQQGIVHYPFGGTGFKGGGAWYLGESRDEFEGALEHPKNQQDVQSRFQSLIAQMTEVTAGQQ